MDISQSYLSAYDAQMLQLNAGQGEKAKTKPAATHYGLYKHHKNKALLTLTHELSSPKQSSAALQNHYLTVMLPIEALDPEKTMFPLHAKKVGYKIRVAVPTYEDVLREVTLLVDYTCYDDPQFAGLPAKLAHELCACISSNIPAHNPRLVPNLAITSKDKDLLYKEKYQRYSEELRKRKETGFVFAVQSQLYVYDSGLAFLERRKDLAEMGNAADEQCLFTPEINDPDCTTYLQDSKCSRDSAAFVQRQYLPGDSNDLQPQKEQAKLLPTFAELEGKKRTELIQNAISSRRSQLYTEEKALFDEATRNCTFIPTVTDIGHKFVNDVKSFAARSEVKYGEARAKRQMALGSATEKRMAVCTFSPVLERTKQDALYLSAVEAKKGEGDVTRRLLIDTQMRQVQHTARQEQRAREVAQAEADAIAEATKKSVRARSESYDRPYMSANRFEHKEKLQKSYTSYSGSGYLLKDAGRASYKDSPFGAGAGYKRQGLAY